MNETDLCGEAPRVPRTKRALDGNGEMSVNVRTSANYVVNVKTNVFRDAKQNNCANAN